MNIFTAKGYIRRCIEIVITILIIIFIYQLLPFIVNRFITSGPWTFLKYNSQLYVLTSAKNIEPSQIDKLTKVGNVKKEILIFSKPKHNNESNALKKGTEIYASDKGEIIIKFKDKFYSLENTATTDGWGNGMPTILH